MSLRNNKGIFKLISGVFMKSLLAKIFFFAMIATFATFSIASAEGMKELKVKTSATNYIAKDKIESITILLKGVEESNLNLDNKILTVKYDPSIMSADMLVKTIKNIGFDADVVENAKDETSKKNSSSK